MDDTKVLWGLRPLKLLEEYIVPCETLHLISLSSVFFPGGLYPVLCSPSLPPSLSSSPCVPSLLLVSIYPCVPSCCSSSILSPPFLSSLLSPLLLSSFCSLYIPIFLLHSCPSQATTGSPPSCLLSILSLCFYSSSTNSRSSSRFLVTLFPPSSSAKFTKGSRLKKGH